MPNSYNFVDKIIVQIITENVVMRIYGKKNITPSKPKANHYIY